MARHTYIHGRAYIYTWMGIYIYMDGHIYIHTWLDIYTYMAEYIHIYTHGWLGIYIYIFTRLLSIPVGDESLTLQNNGLIVTSMSRTNYTEIIRSSTRDQLTQLG